MTKLKALSLVQARDYVLEHHGPEGVESMKAALSEETRAIIYVDPLLPTDWVGVDHAVEHALAYDGIFGTGDGRTSAQMCRVLYDRHITGIYRALVAGTTPQATLEKSSRVWTRYYDRGESHIEMVDDTTAIKRILGCPDMPRYHDWLSTPYYESLLRHCGAKAVSIKHIKCVAHGAECCETELRWRP
jgi:hypothetical protein